MEVSATAGEQHCKQHCCTAHCTQHTAHCSNAHFTLHTAQHCFVQLCKTLHAEQWRLIHHLPEDYSAKTGEYLLYHVKNGCFSRQLYSMLEVSDSQHVATQDSAYSCMQGEFLKPGLPLESSKLDAENYAR